MNYKRKLKSELSKIETPSIEKILGKEEAKKRLEKKRLALIPILAIILSIAVVGCSAFSVPLLIKHFNAKMLTENNNQLTEVPEGYIGIYTAEELNNIRNSPSKNYILMSDIIFSDSDFASGGTFEGGWLPIENGFDGIFNGNGHVIKNISISTSEARQSYGIFGDTRGFFINLGIEELDLSIVTENAKYIRIGAIAGRATFVGGCYLKGGNISLAVDSTMSDACVGGLVGISEHVDSCISYADISLSGAAENVISSGLCAGRTVSAITSLGVGKIMGSTSGIADISKTDILPTLITKEAMNKLLDRLGKGDFGEFYKTKLRSVYFSLDTSLENEDLKKFSEKYIELNKYFEFIDTSSDEIYFSERGPISTSYTEDLGKAIVEAFGSYEAYIEFCAQNGIKCGIINCYTFEHESDIKSEALEGFDFDNIFSKKEGKVAIRIFE